MNGQTTQEREIFDEKTEQNSVIHINAEREVEWE